MKKRRIFAGSIAGLLLCLPPLAAACDISCAFASMTSDCHSQRVDVQDSGSGGMKMDNMAMDGMSMPEMSHSQGSQASSAISGTAANHPSIGEMGPCEKQSCEGDSPVSANANGSFAPRHSLIWAAIEIPNMNGAPPLLHDARDAIATHLVHYGSSPQFSLRI